MPEVDPAVLDRIRKLLARATPSSHTGQDFDGEMEAALSQVNRILAKHQLSLEGVQELLAEGEEKDSLAGVTHGTVGMGVNNTDNFSWCRILASAVAKVTFTKNLYINVPRTFIFIGEATAVQTAIELYTHLSTQVKLSCNAMRKQLNILPNSRRYTKFRREFLQGICTRVGQRVIVLLEKNEESTALVPITNERNEKYTEEVFNPGTARAQKPQEVSVYTELGYAMGEEVPIMPVKASLPGTGPKTDLSNMRIQTALQHPAVVAFIEKAVQNPLYASLATIHRELNTRRFKVEGFGGMLSDEPSTILTTDYNSQNLLPKTARDRAVSLQNRILRAGGITGEESYPFPWGVIERAEK